MCLKCEKVVEKFQHKPSKPKIECKECGHKEFDRIIGKIRHKITYDAKGTYKNRIQPEINRINKNIADGKDKDFLDITGD
jgi:DNA-directed RNA polymerase subunit RPC12/RpoP